MQKNPTFQTIIKIETKFLSVKKIGKTNKFEMKLECKLFLRKIFSTCDGCGEKKVEIGSEMHIFVKNMIVNIRYLISYFHLFLVLF